MSTVATERVTRTPGICGARACIAGPPNSRYGCPGSLRSGGIDACPDRRAIPSITLSDVHSALAYYYDHQGEIESDIHENADAADQLRARFPSALPPPVND